MNLNFNELIDKLDKKIIRVILISVFLVLNFLYFSSENTLNNLKLYDFVTKFNLYIPILTVVIDVIFLLFISLKLIQYLKNNYKITRVL